MTTKMAWEMDCVTQFATTNSFSTTTAHRDALFSSNAFGCRSGVSEYKVDFPTLSTFWFHGAFYMDDYTTGAHNYILLFRNGTTDQFRLVPSASFTASGQTFQFQRWTGSAWTQVGSFSVAIAIDTLYRIDLFVDIHASTGAAKLYFNGVLVGSASGNVSGPSSACDNVILSGSRPTLVVQYWSQVCVSSINTLAHHVATLHPSAAGTYAEWSAAYTAVDEFDDSVADSTDTNATGQRLLYAFDDPSASVTSSSPTRLVKALQVSFRALLEAASTPTNIEAMVRTGGTDYTSGNLGGLTTSVLPFSYTWELSPNTSAAWTFSNINSAEAGFKSA